MRALLLLLLAAPARAWDADPAEARERLRGLDAAFAIMGPARAKAAAARQDALPAWTRRDAWTQTVDGRAWAFGVGVETRVRNPELRLLAAEDRARRRLAALVGASALAGARAIDWVQDPDGTMRALVVLVPDEKVK